VRTIRVLQLNIWARYGPYRERVPRLRRLFEELAPDLVALQEVDVAPDGRSQADELLDGLGYDIAFLAQGSAADQPGIAVAARLPILRHETIELPHTGVALAARIGLGDEHFWFCSAVPLSWLPGREGEREDECLALDDWLGGLAGEDRIPPVLAGDFDATPDAASIRFLTGLQSLRDRSTYWADAFALAGDGSAGYTWTSDSPYVRPFAEAIFAEPNHHRRIDYVFIGSPIRWPPRIVVTSCRVVGRFEDGAAPSDHHGVYAELEVDGDRVGRGGGFATWDAAAIELWPDHAEALRRPNSSG
jgi:endonuclease/exonuclease/phosphatase family metal-dependent hydrolase